MCLQQISVFLLRLAVSEWNRIKKDSFKHSWQTTVLYCYGVVSRGSCKYFPGYFIVNSLASSITFCLSSSQEFHSACFLEHFLMVKNYWSWWLLAHVIWIWDFGLIFWTLDSGLQTQACKESHKKFNANEGLRIWA